MKGLFYLRKSIKSGFYHIFKGLEKGKKKELIREWWRTTTIYQIYPRSFYDSNGDGVGDIRGIIEKLDYLKDLGVETLWISPFYKSPAMDLGYDISDYLDVDPQLGTLDDVQELIEQVHRRGMRILFDMVMNHTSNKHPWFLESRSSLDNPKRDWYIWRSGRGKKTPNNWKSMIGKKGWSYDRITNQWYYSSFLNFQPDLNWANPEVRKTMFNIVRHWLDLGVDGFRLDIFNCLGKDEHFRDNPFTFRLIPTPNNNDRGFFQHKIHSINHRDSFQIAKELRKVIEEYPHRMLIGEVSGNNKILQKFLGEGHRGLHLVFNFEMLRFKPNKEWFRVFIESMERDFSGSYLPTYLFSNHDIGRGLSRVGNSMEMGKLMALVQMTSRCVPVMYYGDEIGMGNHNLPMKTAKDPLARSYAWIPKNFALKFGESLNRDDCRTPMQWDPRPGRGFSADKRAVPWLPTIPKTRGRDVASQRGNQDSLLECYRWLLGLRREHKALNRGGVYLLSSGLDVLAYVRVHKNEKLLIVMNWGKRNQEYISSSKVKKRLFFTNEGVRERDRSITLPPRSGAIFLIDK